MPSISYPKEQFFRNQSLQQAPEFSRLCLCLRITQDTQQVAQHKL